MMNIIYLQVSLVVGALILILLLMAEYRHRFRLFVEALSPGAVMLFVAFSFINVTIYLLLCFYFLQRDPLALFLASATTEGLDISSSMIFQPIIIALMYFGTGAVPLKIGNLEFGFYDKILGSIEKLLPSQAEPPDHDTVSKALAQYDEYQTLLKKIDELRTMANANNRWDSLDEEWKKSNIKPLTTELDHFAALLKKLKSNESRENIVNDLRSDLDLDLNALRTKAHDFVYKFIAENAKTPGDVEQIYKKGLGYSISPSPPKPSSRIKRALVMSASFGLLFGPIFAITTEGAPSIVYAIIGALALGTFGMIFGVTVERSGQNIAGYLFGGATAGFMAQIVWILAMLWMIDQSLPDGSLLIRGTSIGVLMAASLFIIRFHVTKMFKEPEKSLWLLYSFTAIAGAIVLPLSEFLLSIGEYDLRIQSVMLQMAIGAVASIGVAFGTDIFADLDNTSN